MCAPIDVDPLAGFTRLDPMQYLDLPDPDAARATAVIEMERFNAVVGQEVARLSKRYCDIGIQSMIVEFETPLLDDAIAGQILRAIYIWDSSGDPIGWRLDQLGERFRCARGDDPWADLCP